MTLQKVVQEMLLTVKSILIAYGGLVKSILYPHFTKKSEKFAFIVHPRNLSDVDDIFPLIRHLPESLQYWFLSFMPSMKVRDITSSEKTIQGDLIATFITPWHLLNQQRWSVIRTLQAGLLSEKNQASIVGLGAYIPAISDYGRRFLKTKIGPYKPFKGNYTTGHATTAWMISEFVFQTIQKLEIQNANVAIVGGAGSTGTAAAKFMGRNPLIHTISLFDVDRQSKIDRMEKTKAELHDFAHVAIHTNLNGLRECDIIVVVTTAEGTIIQDEHLKPGAVIIDDSQPRNTSESLLEVRDDILIIDVLSYFSGLNAHYNFKLVENQPDIVFTCLAEVAILASHGWNDHFSIGILDVEKIDQIKKMGEAIGVEPAPFLQFNKPVSESQWERVRKAREESTLAINIKAAS